MPRNDLSKDLIHWIKGETFDAAFNVLRAIVREQRLAGGAGNIKGGYTCVCFTGAPKDEFHRIAGKYKPFGIQVRKDWEFALGARPAIYQTEEEFELLPDTHKWRHVRYEPNSEPSIDFTWERVATPSD